MVNIKLDKTGGLTEALALRPPRRRGLRVMVGCMVGSSLAMAPAVLVAQGAEVVDLDGPLLLAEDRDVPLRFEGSGCIRPNRRFGASRPRRSGSGAGPDDPDPLLVQIGAVHLSLDPPFGLRRTFDCIVRPVGRDGPVAPPEFFTKLTGIDGDRVAREGVPLSEALEGFASFTGDAPIFSWGKDEITSIAPACFVPGIVCPIPVRRFGMPRAPAEAGVPLDVVHGLRSHTLPAHFGLEPETRGHDGCSRCPRRRPRSVASVVGGRLSASDFALPPGGT
jgi:hypothetical protein